MSRGMDVAAQKFSLTAAAGSGGWEAQSGAHPERLLCQPLQLLLQDSTRHRAHSVLLAGEGAAASVAA